MVLQYLMRVGLKADVAGYLAGIFICENCDRYKRGHLSETGFCISPEWQIIQNPKKETLYHTVCSENCKSALMIDLNDESTQSFALS
ncbi:MAG: hypothetical protein LW832_07935 [Parachlamydia sp.]|jgi:hypothetical protein|nr:hypothetical protein [Parachlamydia sp.]